MFKTAFSLAFFVAFRISELVSPSKRVHGGMLDREVTCGEDRVSLLLRWSKTDQAGRGRRVQIFAVPALPLCPVGAVREFLTVRPDLAGSFLLHADGSPLSRFQFISIFRKCLRALGLEEKEFILHSFRIGAATEAARCGLDDEAAKRIGRWFQLYVHPHLLSDWGGRSFCECSVLVSLCLRACLVLFVVLFLLFQVV